MRVVDIIDKKKNKLSLTKEEIFYIVENYNNLEIPDYQMSALLMAIVLNGMSEEETFYLTEAMLNSGDILDLSKYNGKVIDKHSTGGIGDKITIILGPVMAALGLVVAKMSGRGLGITGGTADKLESISGYKLSLTEDELKKQLDDIGIALTYNIGNLAPADKKIYALRDVTATVESIPLIASSIMSKKIASGSDALVLDVKFGTGALVKTREEAISLANLMIKIGNYFNKKVRAVITNMNVPLGYNIGNKLEVKECLEVLNGNGSKDLIDVTVALASNLLNMVTGKDIKTCREEALEVIKNGKALNKFKELIKYQGGNFNSIASDINAKVYKVLADGEGYVNELISENIGRASMCLKAGRSTKEDKIDYDAGIVLIKKINSSVKVGDELAYLYYNDDSKLEDAIKLVKDAYIIKADKVEDVTLIYDVL